MQSVLEWICILRMHTEHGCIRPTGLGGDKKASQWLDTKMQVVLRVLVIRCGRQKPGGHSDPGMLPSCLVFMLLNEFSHGNLRSGSTPCLPSVHFRRCGQCMASFDCGLLGGCPLPSIGTIPPWPERQTFRRTVTVSLFVFWTGFEQ